VGANATVLSGLTIGRWAMVGAGAVVTADVADHALVVGNPARQAGWACECGRTLPEGLACGCGRSYRLTGAGTLEERSSAAGHDG
jgi:UDP-2-acetamido-3-amino-2,3-dideoxy-glucuronate N-acetyltransferase